MFSFVSSALRSALVSKSEKKASATRHGAWRRPRFEDMENRYSPSSLAGDFAVLDEFGVFALSNSKLSLSAGASEVGGDVGLGPNASTNFTQGKIDGALVIDPTAHYSYGGPNQVKIAGGVVTRNLQPAVNDAIDASNRIASMTATQTFNTIGNGTTINSTTRVNVINANSVALSGSGTLTLNGSSSDYFLINVSGGFSMSGGAAIKLTGGIDTTHVLFNITGAGSKVSFTGGTTAVGTFLAVNRDIGISVVHVHGVVIGGMNHSISISSGAQVQINAPHFAAPSWL